MKRTPRQLHLPATLGIAHRLVIAAGLLLALLLGSTSVYASTLPILASDTELSSIQGSIDYMPADDNLDVTALVAGHYDEHFLHYDSKQALVNPHGIWLRFRITNTTRDNTLVISSGDTLYTDIELLYMGEDGIPVSQHAGMLYPYIQKTWGYHDIAFAVDQPIDTTRTYYLRFVVTFPLLLDGYVASPPAYAKKQAEDASIGHLLVGIMLGIMLYLTMISTYVKSLKEIRYCLGFVATSFTVLLFGRGYIFSLFPHSVWLNLHLYSLIFTALTVTYTAFSRYHFKTQDDFPMVDTMLKYQQYTMALLLIAGLFIPVSWSVAIIQLMAFLIIAFLCIISVYIWSNSMRHMAAYMTGTLIFLFACILTTAESNALIDFAGKTREGFEFALCFQSMLFALALAEKITGFQHDQTRLAIHAAEVEAENRAKNSFLAKMSHELRTPMNGLLGMVQLLENTQLNDQQKHYLLVMRNSGRLLLGVIDDVLDYSRIVAGKLKIEPTEFNLAELLDDIETLFTETARLKQLQLHVNLVSTNTIHLYGDAMRLRQILANLVSNAIKFTTTGSVTVRIRVDQSSENDWILHGEVEDTGCGIEAEQMPNIFQEYAQSSMTRNYGGSGLGLAICKQLVEMMGGNLHVESAPGYGSLFRFFVHLSPTQRPESSNKSRQRQPIRSASPKDIRILVVEDNDINREVIGGLLAKLGISATFAVNGSEAITHICKDASNWDLVMMDVEMPVMDGLSAAQKIRIWEAEQFRNAVPIVALTAHVGRGYEDAILKAGMDDHLSKPIDFSDLQNILHKWIGFTTQSTP